MVDAECEGFQRRVGLEVPLPVLKACVGGSTGDVGCWTGGSGVRVDVGTEAVGGGVGVGISYCEADGTVFASVHWS